MWRGFWFWEIKLVIIDRIFWDQLEDILLVKKARLYNILLKSSLSVIEPLFLSWCLQNYGDNTIQYTFAISFWLVQKKNEFNISSFLCGRLILSGLFFYFIFFIICVFQKSNQLSSLKNLNCESQILKQIASLIFINHNLFILSFHS